MGKAKKRNSEELQALLILPGGGRVWRDGRGRYRDAATGRYLPRVEVERELQLANGDPSTPLGARLGIEDQEAGEAKNKKSDLVESEKEEGGKDIEKAREAAREQMLRSVQGEGHEAGSAAEAWGRLVGVQAEIALDKDMGSKATAAAKLVALATGMLPEARRRNTPPAGASLEIGGALAAKLVDLVMERREREEQ